MNFFVNDPVMQEALSKSRVLVVDDFQGMRTILRDLVRAMGVPQVETASNGREALAKLRGSRFDVVICDFNLGPGLNGQQVLDEARLHDAIGLSTIWIMVTAEKTPDMIMGAAEARPDEYLLKPINQNILQNRIERILLKKQALRSVEEAMRSRNWAYALERCEKLMQGEAAKAPDLIRLKGDLLIKLGEYEAAKSLYESVLAIRSLPWARTGLGKVYFHQGQFDFARRAFGQVLDENRMFIEASDWLAKTYEALGNPTQAQQILMDAVKLSPNSAVRQQKLGETAYHNGDLTVAQEALKKTIEISEFSTNKQPAAYVQLARVLNEVDEGAIAIKLLTKARDVFKGDHDMAVQTAAVQGAIHQKMGQMELADQAMAQVDSLLAVQGGKVSPQVAMEVAQTMLALGRKDDACALMGNLVKARHEDKALTEQVQKLFEQANMGDEGRELITASRDEAISINNQGVVLGREGKFAEGAKLLRVAIQNLPHSEVMMMNLCGLLIGQIRAEGRTDALMSEILDLLNQVREINPDNQKYRQYTTMLRTMGR